MEDEYRQWGTKEGGGFNELTLAYKHNPTMETYLALRRAHPDAEIEISASRGLDTLFRIEQELQKHGFDPSDIAAILDADHEAISKVSLQCMEKLIAAKELAAKGETHLVGRGMAVPLALIDWIIIVALDGMSWTEQLEIPRDLIVLIQNRLGGIQGKYYRNSELRERKQNALFIAGQMLARGEKTGIRQLARLLGLEASSVSRWFAEGEFERESQRYASWFDENGSLKPLLHRK
ncbi:hypothetical protein ABK249_16545 [Neorhizobium sp. Rsf11]|uniref:Uncharacterized protein n=1 Tax=Neorhizobium phenanthreniclasticum TaxID=3157917 RepID=A0ABV0M3V4_9HYPH